MTALNRGDSKGRVTMLAGGAVAPVQSTVDRRIDATVVPCPDCGVQAGERCLNASGRPITRHPARRRMAIRAENASYDHSDVLYANRCSAGGRAVARLNADLTVEQLAAQLGVTPNVVRNYESGRTNPRGPNGAAYGMFLRKHLSGGAA